MTLKRGEFSHRNVAVKDASSSAKSSELSQPFVRSSSNMNSSTVAANVEVSAVQSDPDLNSALQYFRNTTVVRSSANVAKPADILSAKIVHVAEKVDRNNIHSVAQQVLFRISVIIL